MVNVLLFGATGFVGSPIAHSLRRGGHIVHAIVRDPTSQKAVELEKNEIITHKGDAKDGASWNDLAKGMDVVIDAGDTFVGKDVFETTLEAVKSRPKGAPKLTYIYTSGLW
jgi:nucleoside-diphosphate-sugar epimerase